MDGNTLFKATDDVRRLLAARLGVRGNSLAAQLRKARPQLPRRIRKQITVLIDAGELAAHPRLRHQIDQSAIKSAWGEVTAWLERIDPAERRKARILDVLGWAALYALVIAGIALYVARSRGLI